MKHLKGTNNKKKSHFWKQTCCSAAKQTLKVIICCSISFDTVLLSPCFRGNRVNRLNESNLWPPTVQQAASKINDCPCSMCVLFPLSKLKTFWVHSHVRSVFFWGNKRAHWGLTEILHSWEECGGVQGLLERTSNNELFSDLKLGMRLKSLLNTNVS